MNIYLFNLIHGLSQYNFINYISIFLSYFFIYLLPIILIIWAYYYQKRKMYYFSILFLSIIGTWFLSQLIKSITAIARPIVSNPLIIEHGYSFPSQHSALTMVVAVAIYSINKRLGMFLFTMSVLVGISRIILGVHFPIDVITGWILGWVVGLIFIRLFKNV